MSHKPPRAHMHLYAPTKNWLIKKSCHIMFVYKGSTYTHVIIMYLLIITLLTIKNKCINNYIKLYHVKK